MSKNPQYALQKSKSSIGLELMKTYIIKKTQNMYKLNLSDEQAFKWKFNKNKSNRPLSSFDLIKTGPQQSAAEVTLEDMKDFRFPVLGYKTKQLVVFGQMMLKENEYFRKQLGGNRDFLSNLIKEISLQYNIVSYHNFSHAFSLSLMLFQSFEYHQPLKQIYTPEQQFYALLAGLAHDINHPGTNNSYDVKIKTQRALESSNQSVLEKFHARQFWILLEKNPSINFLTKVQHPQKVKHFITYLILTTDVAFHFKNLQKLKLKYQPQTTKTPLQIQNDSQEKKFFLGQLFHACDIGNPCIDFDNYISWAALLSYQFNEQTILQKENKVEVTEMFRYKDLETFYKGQLGFINFMVLPLWKQMANLCSGLSVFVDNIENNIKMLNKSIQQTKQEVQNTESKT